MQRWRWKLCLAASLASCLATVGVLRTLGAQGLPSEIRLENPRVKVTEVTHPPGVPRPRGVRPADQVIVFLDDCSYERTDPQTGERTIRRRKAGEVIWHDKGEDAPQLVNTGARPYRTLVIELK